MLDQTGTLSDLVLDAVKDGAVATNCPNDPHGSLVLVFQKATELKAFRQKLGQSVPATDEPEAGE